ncbi:MAG: complex I NDUFA9 subunit family protein [Alphaproteobacteria bacterium]|nr:complex I NDUFA9 subunit family protein [Alphaproteobacteria bacterium]
MFGGTGFIGRHLVALLLHSGTTVRVAVRDPGGAKMAVEATNSPEIVQADIHDETSVGRAIAGANAIFNLVGILTETATQTYHAIHVEGARRVALAAQRQGVTRLIQLSALGASLASPAISDRTKAEGEHAVREVFPQATIVRPSLTYGEDDHFFSRFAAMIRSSPVLPLIGGGVTKFQPVSVVDMTSGLAELLKRPDTAGKTYEFGGPQVYSFKELLELLLSALNRQRVLLPVPFALAEIQAGLLELLPNAPLTRDQVRLLKTDKVVSGLEPTLGDLGVQARPLEQFLTAFRDSTVRG